MAAMFPGEVLSVVDRERGALGEAREGAVRAFGRGASVWVEEGALGGYRGRVLDGRQRGRVLVAGATALEVLVAIVRTLDALEPEVAS